MNSNLSVRMSRALRVVTLVFAGTVAACSSTRITDNNKPPEVVPPLGYTVLPIGHIPGDNQSAGFAVNSAGHVVGQSVSAASRPRAFYWDGSFRELTTAGLTGVAYAISNGSTVYVAGYEETAAGLRQASRWTPGTSTVRVILETASSMGHGVNDAGTVVGRYTTDASAVHGAMWRIGTARIDIPPLPGHTHASATDINNDGIVAGTSFGVESTGDKAYVRLADGRQIELTPVSGSTGATASALSDIVNGQFYVAGASINGQGVRRAVRWTVQAASGSVVPLELSGMTVATGVTNDGAVSGVSIAGTVSSSVLWRNGAPITLTTAGNTAGGRGIAGGGGSPIYVVGDAFISNFPIAHRWAIP